MRNWISRRVTIALLMAGGVMSALPAAAEGWEPTKPVELVIMAGQGGGADRLARLIQAIIQKEGLTSMPVVPVNKGGGSGAEALLYLKEKAGDSNVVMATLNSYYTTPLRSDLGVDIKDFTPIARLAEDTFIIWVNAESPIQTLDDYVAAVKEAGGTWIMAGTGTGQEDSLVTAMLEKEFGIDFTYVPMDGGGDVATALVGGQAQSTVNNPSEQMGFFEAGKVRPIAIIASERLASLPDVPTMAELGHPMDYKMQRSFVAPAGMPAEAVAFYTDLFQKVSESEEWQTYAKEEGLLTNFEAGQPLQDYFLVERDKHAAILKELGE
ncbi:MAG: tripartite tricarboxylate transporter substrate binding protein [Tabrizicola sp.]|nr:tripartite tricarboxylate transporter substrate binding protein [Tabrizicola sp.]